MIYRAGLLAVLLSASALATEPEAMHKFALAQAQKHLPAKMNNPASADFDADSVKSRALEGWTAGGRWFEVSGVVRGTNAFNAVVPNRWTAYVVNRDEQLELGLLMIKDKVVHAGPAGPEAIEELERILQGMRDEQAAAESHGQQKRAAKEDAERRATAKEVEALRAQIAMRRQSRSEAAEAVRLSAVRERGRVDGHAKTMAMGYGRGRLSEKEAEKRARKAAAAAKIADADIESYVDGYVSGAMTAKAGKPLAR